MRKRLGSCIALVALAALASAQEAVVVDSTFHDLQQNASLGKLLAVSSDGLVHGALMGGDSLGAHRRVKAWCVGPDLLPIGPGNVSDERSGYATVAVSSANPGNGLAPNTGVVGFHTSLGSWIGMDFAGCSLAFNLLRESEDSDVLWPHIAVDYQDRIHMVCGDASTGIFEDAVWYNATTDGLAWDGNYAQVTESSLVQSQITAAAKQGPGAAILFVDRAPASPGFPEQPASFLCQDIFLYEARDADNDLFTRLAAGPPLDLTRYWDQESAVPFRFGASAYADVDAIYDDQVEPDLLLAWSTPRSLPDTLIYLDLASGAEIRMGYAAVEPWHAAVWFRNATSGLWGHIAGWLTGDDESDTPGDDVVLESFHCAEERPQLAQDPSTGLLYALWKRYSPDDLSAVDGGERQPNGELYLACSADGGLSWGSRVNISNTPSPDCVAPDCLSEGSASLAERVDGGFLHISYLLDRHPGTDFSGDPGDPNITKNPYVYLRVPVALVPPPAGAAWDAAGHIGLDHYRRPWIFFAGHPDTMGLVDKVSLFNEGDQVRHLTELILFHDAQDVLGDPQSSLFASWEVKPGDALEPGPWLANPGAADWDGALPARGVTLAHLITGHRGLPQREQAFRFRFDDGTERVYRCVYEGENGQGSRVDVIDLEQLEQYAADTLYHNDAFESVPRERPEAFTLLAAAPNPFNPATEISFSLAAPVETRLTVFNLMGERVARLVDGPLPAGVHHARFDGVGLASGVYLAALETGGRREAIKLLLAK